MPAAVSVALAIPLTAPAIAGPQWYTATATTAPTDEAIAVTLGYRHSPPQIAAAAPGSVAQRFAVRLPTRLRAA